MYAKMAYEAQMEREKQATSESKQNQLRQKKKTPLIIEIDNGSKSMSVEVDNPFDDIDVQIVGQKEGTPTPTLTPIKRYDDGRKVNCTSGYYDCRR